MSEVKTYVILRRNRETGHPGLWIVKDTLEALAEKCADAYNETFIFSMTPALVPAITRWGGTQLKMEDQLKPTQELLLALTAIDTALTGMNKEQLIKSSMTAQSYINKSVLRRIDMLTQLEAEAEIIDLRKEAQDGTTSNPE